MLLELHSLVSGRTNCTPYSCIPIPTWWDLVSLESAAGLQNSSACWLERAVVLRHCPQIWSLWPPRWAKTNKNKSSLCFDFYECSRCKLIHKRWSLHLCFHCKPKKRHTFSHNNAKTCIFTCVAVWYGNLTSTHRGNCWCLVWQRNNGIARGFLDSMCFCTRHKVKVGFLGITSWQWRKRFVTLKLYVESGHGSMFCE